MAMSDDEFCKLRNEIVKLHALVRAVGDAASVIEGTDSKVERTQALCEVTERHAAQVVLLVEIASVPALRIA